MWSRKYSLGRRLSHGVWSRIAFQSKSMCHITDTAHSCCTSMNANCRVGNFSNTPSQISDAACALAAAGRAILVSM